MKLINTTYFRYATVAFAAVAISMSSALEAAGETPDEFRRRIEQEYNSFSTEVNNTFNSFRDKVNSEYADFMEHPWRQVKQTEPLRRPSEPDPEPIIMRDDEPVTPTAPKPIVIDSLRLPVAPTTPRPQPIGPIETTPYEQTAQTVKLTFFGTPVTFPQIDLSSFRISGTQPKHFADGWRKLTKANIDPIIKRSLDLRSKLNLSDWHYFRLVDRICALLAGNDTNEQTLLTGYILSQAGYDIRFAIQSSTGRLLMLFSTTGTIYGLARYTSGSQWYYPYKNAEGSITMCDISMPGATPMSLAIEKIPALSFAPAQERKVTVHGHSSITLTVTPNSNLIDMLADYPEAGATKDVMSRWTTYAQTPASPQIVEQVYPTLRKAIEGLNQYQAVGLLLKVAQSFPYDYDDKLWGRDRVFFMDESWNYPYSDCEDHAINLTRMVRDLMGLETALLHYPGHIAAAVAITDGSAKGDYVTARNDSRRYTVCDPTYFYASPGATAPSYRAATPTLIPLR